jgi:hypothetical protein
MNGNESKAMRKKESIGPGIEISVSLFKFSDF